MKTMKELYLALDNTLTDDLLDRIINKGVVGDKILNLLETGNKKLECRVGDDIVNALHDNFIKKVYIASLRKFSDNFSNDSFNERFKKINIGAYYAFNELPDSINGYDDLKLLTKTNKFMKFAFFGLPESSDDWISIHSGSLGLCFNEDTKVDHEIYLNIASEDIPLFAINYINKCTNKEIDHYFKYSLGDNKTNSVVLFVDNRNLADTLETIQEIKKEGKIEFGDVPLLTAKIENGVGYGSVSSKENKSFNEIRADILKESLKEVQKYWLDKFSIKNFKYKDNNINYYYIMACNATLRLSKIFDLTNPMWNKLVNKNPDLLNKDGSLNENIFLKKLLKSGIITRSTTEYNLTDSVKSRYLLDGCLEIKPQYLLNGLVNSSRIINEIDPSFKEMYKRVIKRKCIENNIDYDKFSFDVTKRDMLVDSIGMYNEDKAVNSDHYDKLKENIYNGDAVLDGALITKENISLYIDGDLDAKVLANNQLITKKELVNRMFDLIPDDGYFTMKDGTRVQFNEFINNNILKDCLNNYNGDYVKYLGSFTRLNDGVLEIDLDGSKQVISAKESGLLVLDNKNRIITDRDKTKVMAREYVNDRFSHLIPGDGMFTLKDGLRVSAKDFINYYLLGDDNKDNLDVPYKVVASKCKNNTGVIYVNKELEKQRAEKKRLIIK